MKKIIITGGTGRFGFILKNNKTKHKLFFPSKRELDIKKLKTIQNYLALKKPNILIHLAGLSRPMNVHEKNIKKSIDLNIIGTANITKACEEKNVKLIYFSTNYVYPGTVGNYKENDSLLPVNNYAWSKLGGGVPQYTFIKIHWYWEFVWQKNHLFIKKLFLISKTSFMYQEDVAKILFKLINKKGIINIGGPSMYIYDFVRKK